MHLTCFDENELFDPLIPLFNKVVILCQLHNWGDIYSQFQTYYGKWTVLGYKKMGLILKIMAISRYVGFSFLLWLNQHWLTGGQNLKVWRKSSSPCLLVGIRCIALSWSEALAFKDRDEHSLVLWLVLRLGFGAFSSSSSSFFLVLLLFFLIYK